MNVRRRYILVALVLAMATPGVCPGSGQADVGTEPSTPTLLAPGLINTGVNTRDVTMTPDGNEMYFCMAAPGYRYAVILVTRLVDGVWSEPVVAPFSGSTEWIDLEPFISPDGRRFFFMSTRPAVGVETGKSDIWVMDREDDHWGEPRNLGTPVNSNLAEYFPSVTRDGTLYFTRGDSSGRISEIRRSRLVGGEYQESELLPVEVNCGLNRFNASISPDESRLILSAVGVSESHGTVDYFLVRRDNEDRWSDPINLGPVINDGSTRSWSSYVTPGGESFLFMSSRRTDPAPEWPPAWGALQASQRTAGGGSPNIYQVCADFLDSLPGDVELLQLAESSGTEPAPVEFPKLTGPYLGQVPPGDQANVFAPGMVSTGMNERDLLVSPDGRTIWYGFMEQGLVTIMETRLRDGYWTEPKPVPFHQDGDFACFEPTLSADGRTVLFLSNRAAPGQEQGRGWANQNIFSSRLVDGAWSKPTALPAPVTTEAAEYFPSLATDGTLYFSREDDQGNAAIWTAEPADEGFAELRRLPETVNIGEANYNATVAPDESWIIFCVNGHAENQGNSDYWISFREKGDRWGAAVNLGSPFNGPGLRASSVSLSPDGRFLFYSTNKSIPEKFFPNERVTRKGLISLNTSPGNGNTDVWWVDVEVINKLR